MRAERWAERASVDRPGTPSALAVRWIPRLLLPIVRAAHRPTIDGWEHLPSSGPFLLVTNHNGGLGIAEINTFMALYVERFGATKPLAGFTHPASFSLWPLSRLLPHIGAIPSTYAAAERTLDAGVPILVFPGGDHEAFRPIWQAYRVDFGGRRGFLKIARKAWVPIVPMGIRGSHFTGPPLLRARFLSLLFVWPRLIGVKRYALTLSAVLGAALILARVPLALPWRVLFAWAWAASPFAMIPWIPWTIRMRIGAPIAPETLFGDRASTSGGDASDDVLRNASDVVEGAVQRLVAPNPAR